VTHSRGRRRVHAYVADVVSGDRCGIGVLFVDDRGQVLGRIRKTLPHADRDQAVFHGVLAALWEARRLGTRAVAVHVDDPQIVAQINGEEQVAWDLVGPYLQVRALLHAYRDGRVEADFLGWGPAAIAVAEAALRGAGDAVDDLPLWARRVP
jgi:Reverse transcriptase-like